MDLVTFTEEIFNRKLHFLCSDRYMLDGGVSDKRQESLNKVLINFNNCEGLNKLPVSLITSVIRQLCSFLG